MSMILLFKKMIVKTKLGKKLHLYVVKLRFKNDVFDECLMADKLIQFQSSFPVSQIKYGDLSIWPVLRHYIWFKIQLRAKKNINFLRAHPYKKTLSANVKKHLKSAHNCFDLVEIEPDEVELLFFINQNGTEQTFIENEVYHRLTDPIFDEVKGDFKCEKLEIITSGNINDKSYHNDSTKLLVSTLNKHHSKIDYPLYFEQSINNLFTKLNILQFQTHVDVFFDNVYFYTELLKIKKPKAVFFIGYDYSLALIMAANNLGIKTIDLQHGIQVGWSPVYNNLMEDMSKYEHILPSNFFVWGEYDKLHINNVFPCSQADISGFKWLDKFKEYELLDDSVAEWIKKTNKKGNKVGVITLQDQTEFPDEIYRILESIGNRYEWIIKRHPRHNNIVVPPNMKNVFYGDVVDRMPLKAILPHSFVNLTECSTSLIEANYFGVKGICYGSKGLKDYAYFIQHKIIHWIDDEKSCIDTYELNNYLKNEMGSLGIIDNHNDIKKIIEGII